MALLTGDRRTGHIQISEVPEPRNRTINCRCIRYIRSGEVERLQGWSRFFRTAFEDRQIGWKECARFDSLRKDQR